MIVRGPAFSPEDDVALSRAWLEFSGRHNEHSSITFWSTVSSIFARQESTSAHHISHDSLRTLQRLVQKYLATERVYYSKPVSGETAEDSAANVMRLYSS